MSFAPGELEEIERSFHRVLAGLGSFKKQIRTRRELAFLRIGLRAAHLEEAIVQGDSLRAKAHATALLDLLRALDASG